MCSVAGEDVEEIDKCSSTPDLSTGLMPCSSQAHSPLNEAVLPSQNQDRLGLGLLPNKAFS